MSEYTKEQIEEAESRYKTMLAKYHKCLDALEFIAFSDHPAWTNKDRRYMAVKVLIEIGYYCAPEKQSLEQLSANQYAK